MFAGLEAKAIILGIVVLAFLGLLAAVHHYKGKYELEHAQFEAFVAKTEALGEQAKTHKIEIDTANTALKEHENADHAAQLTTIKTSWAADRVERDRLRNQLASARSSPVSSVAIGSNLSCDKAASDAISGAVQGYISGARQALAECRAAASEFRDSVAGLLEQADSNTAALTCGIDWAAKIAK